MISPLRWIHNRLGSRSLGIEVTDTHVKWLETVRKGKDMPEIWTADAEPLPPGAVEEGRITQVTAVIRTLQTLVGRGSVKTKEAHLILPSSLTMVRFLKLPDVRMKDMRRMIDFELKYNIPLPFERPYYDFIKLPAPKAAEEQQEAPSIGGNGGGNGWGGGASDQQWSLGTREAAVSEEKEEEKPPEKQCEVMIVAASLDTIEEYSDLVVSAGLKPVSMEIKALSLYRVAEQLQLLQTDSAFMMLDITQAYSDVSIYRDGFLRLTRNIPVRFPERGSGDAEGWPDFDFQSACQTLQFELDRFINFYRYSLNHRDEELGDLLLSGDIEGLPDVMTYLAERLPFRVKELQLQHVARNHGANVPLIRYAAPLGLSLRGSS